MSLCFCTFKRLQNEVYCGGRDVLWAKRYIRRSSWYFDWRWSVLSKAQSTRSSWQTGPMKVLSHSVSGNEGYVCRPKPHIWNIEEVDCLFEVLTQVREPQMLRAWRDRVTMKNLQSRPTYASSVPCSDNLKFFKSKVLGQHLKLVIGFQKTRHMTREDLDFETESGVKEDNGRRQSER